MAKRVECPAGEWTTLVSNFGSGMAKTFVVDLVAEAGETVEGVFEEKAATWIFPNPPRVGPLQHRLELHRKWINAIYKIRIRPLRRVWATIR